MPLCGTTHAPEDLGKIVAAETGFVLVRDPDTVRGSDIAFIHKDRIPAAGLPKKFIPFAPDVAVEVVSPNDTMDEVEEKVAEWLAAGTKLVWVVLPKRRVIKVYRSSTDVTILTDKDELDGGEVMPGFRLPLPVAWRGLWVNSAIFSLVAKAALRKTVRRYDENQSVTDKSYARACHASECVGAPEVQPPLDAAGRDPNSAARPIAAGCAAAVCVELPFRAAGAKAVVYIFASERGAQSARIASTPSRIARPDGIRSEFELVTLVQRASTFASTCQG